MTHLRSLLSLALTAGCAIASAADNPPTSSGSNGVVPELDESSESNVAEVCSSLAPPTLEADGLTPPVDALVRVSVQIPARAPLRAQWAHKISGEFCGSVPDATTCAATQERFEATFSREETDTASIRRLLARAPASEPGAFGDPPLRQLTPADTTAWRGWFTARGVVNGGEFTWLSSPQDVHDLVGPLDSASDVLLFASLSSNFPGYTRSIEGHQVTCILRSRANWLLRTEVARNDPRYPNRQTWWILSPDGTLTEHPRLNGPPNASIGRLPAGLHWAGGPVDDVAGWLAQAAHLEAASVIAFEILHRELTHYGAPASLLAAVWEAREDEVRHARCVGALAETLGAVVPEVDVAPVPIRSLEAIALENALEGLVRETWGAATGLWQAKHAEMPRVRAMMTEVAEDEVRHAELSRRLHTWLWERLDLTSRAKVAAARVTAWQQLREGVLADPHTARDQALGLPAPDVARRMLDVLSAEVLQTV